MYDKNNTNIIIFILGLNWCMSVQTGQNICSEYK